MFFSCPEGWTEADELQLINEVDALLPQGVSLEFDGRARAMLSHEIKNYALLRHDGRLELRGAAFESSRTEAYGRAFLHDTLRCLLSGDVPGVRAAYLNTLRSLEPRQFTNRDVASRVRLTKTPEQYAATRTERKEAVYEALHALRRTWRAGERASLYHREGHGLVPLDLNPDGRDYDVRHDAAHLQSAYATRLRKALRPEDFRQLFDHSVQPGLFDVKRPPYSEDELADVQAKFLLFLTAHAGLRISEALALEWADLDEAARRIQVQSGKGRKARVVAMSSSLARAARHYRGLYAPGGPDHADGKRTTPSTWVFRYADMTTARYHVEKAFKAAGVKFRGFHPGRKYAGTRLLRQIKDLGRVAAHLGHSSVDTTRRGYAQLAAGDLKDDLAGW